MNHPHEQQAAAMERAGELPDGEQLRECVNSGQVSAAQVVAHAENGELSMSMFASRADYDKAVAHQEAGELPKAVAHRFDIMEGIESKVGSWLYSDGPPKESPFASMQALFTEAQMRAALAAERAEVARLREALKHIHFAAMDITVERSALSFAAGDALNPTQGATNHD